MIPIKSIGPISLRIVHGRLIQVRISGQMDVWLEVCLFGLTPSLNEESWTHTVSSVALKTPLVWNHELYSDQSTKSVNVPLIMIFFLQTEAYKFECFKASCKSRSKGHTCKWFSHLTIKVSRVLAIRTWLQPSELCFVSSHNTVINTHIIFI